MTSLAKGLLVVVGGIGAVIVTSLVLAPSRQQRAPTASQQQQAPASKQAVAPTPRPTPDPRIASGMKVLREAGLLYKHVPELSTFYVDGDLWAATTVDAKNGIAVTLSAYHQQETGKSGRVTIRDKRSDRVLAKYSPSFGLDLDP